MLPEQPVDERVVHRLWLAGALPRERYQPALHLARDDAFWRRWGERAVLALASGHLLAAAVFFFAFNWQDLSPFAKLAVLQAGVTAAALASRAPMLPEPAREALLIAATVLVGVLLAVFGQIYQTGADAWQLFAGWAALILPWALASRSPGHWLLWAVVAQTGIGLWAQHDRFLRSDDGMHVTLLLVALPALAVLVGRELLAGRFPWLQPRWARLVPLVDVLGLLFVGAEMAVIGEAHAAAGLFFAVGMAAAAVVYGRLRRDFAAVALMVLLACGVLATLVGRAMTDDYWLAIAFLIALIFGGGSWLLRSIHRDWVEHGHV